MTHIRNLLVSAIFISCFLSTEIREGFAKSAIGHVVYMLVRAGPVFRLGSVYVGDRQLWQKMTDLERIRTLVMGRHPFMTIEVGSLLLLAAYFLYLRCFYGI